MMLHLRAEQRGKLHWDIQDSDKQTAQVDQTVCVCVCVIKFNNIHCQQ